MVMVMVACNLTVLLLFYCSKLIGFQSLENLPPLPLLILYTCDGVNGLFKVGLGL